MADYSHLGNKTFPPWEQNIPSLGIKSPLLAKRPLVSRETASRYVISLVIYRGEIPRDTITQGYR